VPRFAPFSTSKRRNILPAGPQVIEGGVNDPAPVPRASPIHGSYHWTFERALSIGLVPLTIVPFAAGSVSPAIDAAFVFVLIVHSHMGFQYAAQNLLPTTC
jgi:succinate dehydrogenase (ubiquinone) membrane anchor subunit